MKDSYKNSGLLKKLQNRARALFQSRVFWLCVGLITSAYLSSSLKTQDSTTRGGINFLSLHDRTNGQLTSPLLACSDTEGLSDKTTKEAELEVQKYIHDQQTNNTILTASVYFRDLDNGPWFGINALEPFFPGSLLKVPLSIATVKLATDKPGFLEQKIFYEGGDAGVFQEFLPSQSIKPNNAYTINQLIEYALKYSDNNAALLLNQIIGDDARNKSYIEMGIPKPSAQDYEISVKDYATFFRILYNATYLERPDSERILKILSESDFRDGIVSGLPPGTIVAHKFGERLFESSSEKQLHDCGIVYTAKRPYLVCIMTRGTDFQKLPGVISGISKIIYDHIAG